jgi:hypothetical protein
MTAPSPPRPRGIYLLPNLFTTGGMFAGFYAIIAASAGNYVDACIAVFVAGLLDGLDGRIARLTNTQSELRHGAGPGHVPLVAVAIQNHRSGLGQGRLDRGVLICGLHGLAFGAL